MRVFSAGDRLPRGRFLLHSRFEHAANFTGPGGLLSVVSEEAGAGPVNITADMRSLPPEARVAEYDGGRFFIDGAEAALGGARRYESRVELSPRDRERFSRNCAHAALRLRASAPQGSLAYVLSGGELSTASGREFSRRAVSAARGVAEGRGAAAMRGLGPGFTPSGDDFIAGCLCRLRARELLCGESAESERGSITASAFGGNPVSNAYIECAARGLFFEKMKNFTLALASGDSLDESFGRVMAWGATSGADLLSGFLYKEAFECR